MNLTINTFLIICPMLFLAGLVDAIGGGGGLISLPAYLLAGLPVHSAIATNKLSGSCGTTLATVKFIRRGLVNWRLAVPTVLAAMLGSFLGAKSSMAVEAQVMEKLLLLVLPCAAAIVLKSRGFRETGELRLDRKTWLTALVSAAVVGFYDGFYGPGTGTFLIIAFTVFAHVPLSRANALGVFLTGGQVVFTLGLAGAACNMLGNFLGAELALKQGAKVTRPVILVVLALLGLKIFGII